MNIELDKQMFDGWLDHPITQAVFKRLQSVQEDIRNEMLSEHVIMSEQGSKKLAFLAGERKSLELIFELSIEDIQDETGESTGIQRTSETEEGYS
jgi:hypothetical protein